MHILKKKKKKSVLISNQKAKAKSKCAKYLTDRTFSDKINNEYDLEQLLKHFFFSDSCCERTWRLIV